MDGTIALYTRTSLEDFDKAHRLIDQSQSILHQKWVVTSYIQQHQDLASMRQIEYIDDGYTGTNLERPRFREMIEAARQGRIQCIIVKDLSRLGRSYLDVGEFLERIFPAMGVRFIAVNDGYDSAGLSGSTGGIEFAFRNLIYDSYSKDLSVKVKTAMHARMENGKFVNHTPYGYIKSTLDKHIMMPDPETAPIVREIFQRVKDGCSTSEVAKELNRRGVPTPLKYKQHKLKPACQNRDLIWSHITVLNILNNYKYTGAMVNNLRSSRKLRDRNQRRTTPDEWIITEGAHEPLVSKADFKAAHAKIRKPAKASKPQTKAIDSVFYCGCCGRKLIKTFGLDTYFSCNTPVYRDASDCVDMKWSKTELDKVLLPIYRLQLMLLGEQLLDSKTKVSANDVQSFVKKMGAIEANISRCDAEKIDLYERHFEGQIDPDTLLAAKREITSRQARLRAEYEQAQLEYSQRKQEVEQEQARQNKISDFLSGADLDDEQAISKMYEIIDRVTVFDKTHIDVRWKFDDVFGQLETGGKKLCNVS